MIPVRAVNCFVNSTWMSIPWPLDPIVHSKVHSTHDAAVAIIENDAASTLLPQLVAPREESNSPHKPPVALPQPAETHTPLCPACSKTHSEWPKAHESGTRQIVSSSM